MSPFILAGFPCPMESFTIARPLCRPCRSYRSSLRFRCPGCRFPGNATSPPKLWDLLREPRLVASQVPALKGYCHENGQYPGHANDQEAYLLTEDGEQQYHRRFDAAFFGINPAKAAMLDPQIRLLLETVYEALEAGADGLGAAGV
ncbi:hypothetical protein F4811DRAFT_549333 [Daldinia bambusicola]|nr:hypothetical protein F4811DRAFT_549333 [Daldinia bambusicola]